MKRMYTRYRMHGTKDKSNLKRAEGEKKKKRDDLIPNERNNCECRGSCCLKSTQNGFMSG